MGTPYQDIWDKFNISTVYYDLDSFDTPEQEDYLTKLMSNAIDNTIFNKDKFNLEDRDDTGQIFDDDLPTKVQQIIAEYMIYVWVGRMVYNQDILKQYMSSSAVKKFSPSAHLNTLSQVHTKARHKAENLYKQYAVNISIDKMG